uniref:RRM domain-containing protein n=1 Tax=Steinernema glaseri TaxID=37863 RepID=A0A1I7Y9D7_9BILA
MSNLRIISGKAIEVVIGMVNNFEDQMSQMRSAKSELFIMFFLLVPGFFLLAFFIFKRSGPPVGFRSKIILFKFTKSKDVNAENAQIKFAKVVTQCGGSLGDIEDVETTSEILTVTFRDKESASKVLKAFQEKKIRDELSAEFKLCRVCYDLPEHLQKKRKALFNQIYKEKANDYKYVDESDLTIKTKPGMSTSHKTSSRRSLYHKETQVPQGEREKRRRSAKIKEEPDMSTRGVPKEDSQTYDKHPDFIICYDTKISSKYACMSFTQFTKEVFGFYATDIELKERLADGFKVSLKLKSWTTVEKLLAHLGKSSFLIYYYTKDASKYRHMGFDEFVQEVFGTYAMELKMDARLDRGFDVSLKPTATTSIEKLLMCLPKDVNIAIRIES